MNTGRVAFAIAAAGAILVGYIDADTTAPCDARKAAADLVERGWALLDGCAAEGEPLGVGRFTDVTTSVWAQAGFAYALGDYEGGSVERESFAGTNVYDVAAGSPANLTVQPHSENAYLQSLPHLASFGCMSPAPVGGEMTLTDLAAVSASLPAPLRSKLSRLGVAYERRMGDATRESEFAIRVRARWNRVRTLNREGDLSDGISIRV